MTNRRLNDMNDFVDPYSDVDDEAIASAASLKVAPLGHVTEQLGFDVTEEFVEQQRQLLEQMQDSKPAARPNVTTTMASQCVIPSEIESKVDYDAVCQQYPKELRCHMPSRTGSEMSDIDFTKFLHDEEIILEQQRIFEQILKDRKAKAEDFGSYNTHTRNVADREKACSEKNALNAAAHKTSRNIPLCENPSVNKARYTEVRESRKLSSEDVVTSLPNGKKVLLKGTRHVYDAIAQGTSTIAQCFNCQTLLQVPDSTTAVYCVMCNQVTPMDLARRTKPQGAPIADSDRDAKLQ